MKFKAISEQTKDYSIDWTREKLSVSRTAYYAWLKRPKSGRAKTNALLSI